MSKKEPLFWFSRQDTISDAILVIIPWAWLLWQVSFGINDRKLYDWCIGTFSPIAGCVVGVFLMIMACTKERNIIVRILAALSFIAGGLLAPCFALA